MNKLFLSIIFLLALFGCHSTHFTWPDANEQGWPNDKSAYGILFDRFKEGSKEVLGTPHDLEEIRNKALSSNRSSKVGEIRWLTPDLVMVQTSWRSGNQGGAYYLVVLTKELNDWKVIHRYLLKLS